MLGDDLYLTALKLLRYALIPMFAFGYWGLSNVQIFYNLPSDLVFPNLPGDPKHGAFPATKSLKELNQAHFTLLIFVFWFFRITYDRLMIYFDENGFNEEQKELGKNQNEK